MNGHDDSSDDRIVLWQWALGVLAILYPLSMGPFWGLREHGILTRGSTLERSLVTLYSPVEWLALHLPPFKAVLKAYLELFGPV